jgi:hypothetical protein
MKLTKIGMNIGLALLAGAAWGQSVKLPDGLEKLGVNARDKVEITLDKAMLKLAGHFLSGGGDEAKARKAMDGLDSIYVRSFNFDKEGAYNPADVDAFRAQFQSPAWSRVVGVRSNNSTENIDVFLKPGANGQFGGAVVISAEPRELTIVQITGTIDPAHLADLGGQFHIPHVALGGAR